MSKEILGEMPKRDPERDKGDIEMKQSAYLLLIMAFLMSCLLSCSGGHTQNQEKIRKQNAQAEYIRRRSCEKVYPEPTLEIVQREPYPWEKEEKRTVTSQH